MQYCYVVIATFSDFAESYASNEMCSSLKKDVPIITNVSIIKTDNSNGKLYLAWSKPTEFDTLQFPGPYEYRVLRTEAPNTNFIPIFSTNSLNDTIIIDSNINSQGKSWKYQIDFYNNSLGNTLLIGSSNPASSIFAAALPSDNRVLLSWQENVPWINDYFDVFRYNYLNLTWDSIGTTTTHNYTDFGLQNGTTYCYFIRSVGRYTISGITSPLINLSQEICSIPVDNIPPCAPILSGRTDCEQNYFEWHFGSDTCFNDVVKYQILYSLSQNDGFSVFETINNPQITSISYTGINTIAGCFMVEAIDSNNNISQSNYVCIDIDSCNLYQLPNVFTPNGDGFNDVFHPYPYDFVEHIKITIFNRWGAVIFTSENPDINWDGKDKYSKQDCGEGVYFYVCDVYEYRLGGVKMRSLHGSISLYR
jgi:gliding motility-associated-like protein